MALQPMETISIRLTLPDGKFTKITSGDAYHSEPTWVPGGILVSLKRIESDSSGSKKH